MPSRFEVELVLKFDIESGTEGCAAKCITTSTSEILSKSKTSISSFMNLISLITLDKFDIFPVLRLSTTTILWPILIRKSHKFEPINPAPPVTIIFIN